MVHFYYIVAYSKVYVLPCLHEIDKISSWGFSNENYMSCSPETNKLKKKIVFPTRVELFKKNTVFDRELSDRELSDIDINWSIYNNFFKDIGSEMPPLNVDEVITYKSQQRCRSSKNVNLPQCDGNYWLAIFFEWYTTNLESTSQTGSEHKAAINAAKKKDADLPSTMLRSAYGI